MQTFVIAPLLAAGLVWIPLIAITRWGVVKAVKERRISATVGAIALGLAVAVLPWILSLTGATDGDLEAVVEMSAITGVIMLLGSRFVLARMDK